MARAGKPAGTGSIQLGEPVEGFRCFSDVFADGGEVLIGNERMVLKRMVKRAAKALQEAHSKPLAASTAPKVRDRS